MDKLISRKELAQQLSVSIATIDRMVARKELPALRIGKRILFEEKAIAEFLAKRKA